VTPGWYGVPAPCSALDLAPWVAALARPVDAVSALEHHSLDEVSLAGDEDLVEVGGIEGVHDDRGSGKVEGNDKASPSLVSKASEVETVEPQQVEGDERQGISACAGGEAARDGVEVVAAACGGDELAVEHGWAAESGEDTKLRD